MYNRYIPQSDGTYKRSSVQEPAKPNPPKSEPIYPISPQPVQEHPHPGKSAKTTCRDTRQLHRSMHKDPIGGSIPSFFRNLLPGDFDTGDLIVVLLLLLMAGDKPEDRNTALLTLALYCFL